MSEAIWYRIDCMIVLLMIGLLLSHPCVVAKYMNRGITARGIRGDFCLPNLLACCSLNHLLIRLLRFLYEFQRYEMASGKSSINIC